jgi:hypothetical protein
LYQTKRLISNVEEGIEITINNPSALFTHKDPIGQRQVTLDPATGMTGLGTGIPAIHQLHVAAVLFGLIEQLPLDLEETGI